MDETKMSITNYIEELFLDSKLPDKSSELAKDVLKKKAYTYLKQKKGKVQKMYKRYQSQWIV